MFEEELEVLRLLDHRALLNIFELTFSCCHIIVTIGAPLNGALLNEKYHKLWVAVFFVR